MSYNTVLKTSMPAHYLGRSPSWQPTVYPLTGYTSPLHTPYHSCTCYYQTRRDYPRSPRTVGRYQNSSSLFAVGVPVCDLLTYVVTSLANQVQLNIFFFMSISTL